MLSSQAGTFRLLGAGQTIPGPALVQIALDEPIAGGMGCGIESARELFRTTAGTSKLGLLPLILLLGVADGISAS